MFCVLLKYVSSLILAVHHKTTSGSIVQELLNLNIKKQKACYEEN